MKARFFSVLIFLGIALSASAQDAAAPVQVRLRGAMPPQNRFSLEIGTGLPPIHMLLFPDYLDNEVLAEEGRQTDKTAYSVLSFSGVWRSGEHTEWVLMGGASRCHFTYVQFPVFGTDPQGNPRYNLQDPSYGGWAKTRLSPTLNIMYRYLWNPWNTVVVYYELGLGFGDFSRLTDARVLPGWTPVGVRFGRDHFYFYLEKTFSPVATLFHCGLGWRF